MKTKNIIILGALAVVSLTTVTSCNDFEDINKDPNKADLEQVEPEWFLDVYKRQDFGRSKGFAYG